MDDQDLQNGGFPIRDEFSDLSNEQLQVLNEEEEQISYYDALSSKLPRVIKGASGIGQGTGPEDFQGKIPTHAKPLTFDYVALGEYIINLEPIREVLKKRKISWQLPDIELNYEQDVSNAYQASLGRVVHRTAQLYLNLRGKGETFRFVPEALPVLAGGTRTRCDGVYKIMFPGGGFQTVSGIEKKRYGLLIQEDFANGYLTPFGNETSFRGVGGRVICQGLDYTGDHFCDKVIIYGHTLIIFIRTLGGHAIENKQVSTKHKRPYKWVVPKGHCEMRIFHDKDPRLPRFWLGWILEELFHPKNEARCADCLSGAHSYFPLVNRFLPTGESIDPLDEKACRSFLTDHLKPFARFMRRQLAPPLALAPQPPNPPKAAVEALSRLKLHRSSRFRVIDQQLVLHQAAGIPLLDRASLLLTLKEPTRVAEVAQRIRARTRPSQLTTFLIARSRPAMILRVLRHRWILNTMAKKRVASPARRQARRRTRRNRTRRRTIKRRKTTLHQTTKTSPSRLVSG